jgi:radical SAM protein with 4Fe4S-binding SPASM domain
MPASWLLTSKKDPLVCVDHYKEIPMVPVNILCDTPTIRSAVAGDSIYSIDKQYNFNSTFNMKTGFYMRTGIMKDGKDTEIDPFMASMPQLIDIGVKGSCNFGKSGLCLSSGVECYQNGKTVDNPDMTLDNFTKIIKEVRGKTFQVALGGAGDPDTFGQFREMLEVCRENYIAPNYTTSGFGLTDEKIKISAELCGAIAISEYRNKYTKSAIDRCVSAGMIVNLHYVLGNQSIDDAIDRLERSDFYSGLNAVIFLAHKPIGLGSHKNVLKASDPRVVKFFKLVDEKPQPFKLGFDSCNIPGIVNFTKNINMMSVDSCESGRMSCYISADMKMMPCSFDIQDRKWAIDINTSTVEEAWNSLQFEHFRDTFRKACPDCKKRENCFGGCPITNEITLCIKKNP